jgi:hypothetical protein
MRYFFDTEFFESSADGLATIQLISIGVVCDDGRQLYLENSAFDWDQPMPDRWLEENVRPHLFGPEHSSWQTPAEIANSLRAFTADDTAVEWFAWVGAYDWVALMSVIGRLVDRPDNWPIAVHELKQLAASCYLSKAQLPIMEGIAHNALDDARWNLAVWQACQTRQLS